MIVFNPLCRARVQSNRKLFLHPPSSTADIAFGAQFHYFLIASTRKSFVESALRRANFILQILHLILLILVHNIPQEISQDSLIAWQFGIPREIVDIDHQESVPISSISDHIKVEQVQLHSPPQTPREFRDQAPGRHLRFLQSGRLPRPVPALLADCRIRHLRERHQPLRAPQLLLRNVGQRPALHALHVPAHHVHLEHDAAVIHKLLEHDWGLELAQAAAVENQGHLVRPLAPGGDQRLRDHRERQTLARLLARQPLPIANHYLIWDPKRRPVGTRDLESGNHLEHRDPVVEPADRVRRVHDRRAGVPGAELAELAAPVLAVELVEEAVEGALVGERAAEVNGDEVDAAGTGDGDEGVLDDALLLLGQEGVADGESRLGHFGTDGQDRREALGRNGMQMVLPTSSGSLERACQHKRDSAEC